MFYVYLIRSELENWVYVGFSKNINLRFIEHNSGFVKSTKHYKPFELIFVQIVNNSTEARLLEKFLKVRFNKEALLELIS